MPETRVIAPSRAPARFSVVTACYNDAWPLLRTIRSVAAQRDVSVEHLVIDGGSTDETASMMTFFQGFMDIRFESEPDKGVYDAMNKGVRAAGGDYVTFLNAGDVFEDDGTLNRVDRALVESAEPDGLLGLGRVGDGLWSPWEPCETLSAASLGFCHQALFLRRTALLDEPFAVENRLLSEDRAQLLRLWRAGRRIEIAPLLVASRDPAPGLSADPTRAAAETAAAVAALFDAPGPVAETFTAFRMKGAHATAVLDHALAEFDDARLAAFAPFFIDTLFCRQCRPIGPEEARALIGRLLAALRDRGQAKTILPLLARFTAMKRRETTLRDERRRSRLGETPQMHRIASKGSRMARSRPERADFVVRMTSFPARIDGVADVIDSMLRQSRPPRAIQLVLARQEFAGPEATPPDLAALERDGLSIVWADRNYMHYKKIFPFDPALNAVPVVLCDDDVFYHADDFERLLEAHRRWPDAVCANRVHTMTLDAGGVIRPYAEWISERGVREPSHLNFATGLGGVLYPPGFFALPGVLDLAAICAHAPLADDVWLKFQSILHDRPVVCATEGRWSMRYTRFMEAGALHHHNALGPLNDIQTRRCAAMAHEALGADFARRLQ